MYRSKSTVSDFCFIGIMAAVTAVMAQISIPMPMGVPMTMQTFAVTLAGIILGSRRGALSMLVYLLIGVVGVPVFFELYRRASQSGRANRWIFGVLSDYGLSDRSGDRI